MHLCEQLKNTKKTKVFRVGLNCDLGIAASRENMRNKLFGLLSLVLWVSACSNNKPKSSHTIDDDVQKEAHDYPVDTETLEKPIASKDSLETSRPVVHDRNIILGEKSLDSFSLPFPEKDLLADLSDYYHPYRVTRKTGQQDGPDFEYIDIKNRDEVVLFVAFEYDNPCRINEIRILDTSIADTFGVRIGDSYNVLKKKRPTSFSNSTDYHQHTYLYPKGSNIYYEISGFDMTVDMLDEIEKMVLTEEQMQKCKVESIIWKQNDTPL